MTKERCMFQSLKNKKEGIVTFDINQKGRIISIGIIGINFSPSIDNALLVYDLKHNLLSIIM